MGHNKNTIISGNRLNNSEKVTQKERDRRDEERSE